MVVVYHSSVADMSTGAKRSYTACSLLFSAPSTLPSPGGRVLYLAPVKVLITFLYPLMPALTSTMNLLQRCSLFLFFQSVVLGEHRTAFASPSAITRRRPNRCYTSFFFSISLPFVSVFHPAPGTILITSLHFHRRP